MAQTYKTIDEAREQAQHAADELDAIQRGGQWDDERLEHIITSLKVSQTLCIGAMDDSSAFTTQKPLTAQEKSLLLESLAWLEHYGAPTVFMRPNTKKMSKACNSIAKKLEI